MEQIGIIKSVSPVRVLQGNQGEMKIVDVVIDSGADQLVFSAFDKVAERFTNSENLIGSLVLVHLICSVREKDGKLFQSMRCDLVALLVDFSPKAF